jgi:integrase/recombinase XerD
MPPRSLPILALPSLRSHLQRFLPTASWKAASRTAGLDKMVTVHTLRHSFATHLLEQGVDIHVIQDLLGHRHVDSTARYARVAINTIRQIKSPLDALNIGKPPPA